MDQKSRFLKHWQHEGKTTRKVLSRIPEGSDYRPDPKSRPAREIAWLIAYETKVLADAFEGGDLVWADIPAPATMREVLEAFDRDQARSVAVMNALEPSGWDRAIKFLYGDQEIGSNNGYEHAWGMLLDIIHHRGQITTYLRPMGSTVPQIYGPSADEP